MHFSTITIKDIAAALQLSVSTVSKALRDSYEISAQTKALVLGYARQHNYQPNLMAQSLKQGLSKSIGIVVSTIDNHFFSQVINGIESVAYQEGFTVIITQSHESSDLEMKHIGQLVNRAVDGLLISLSTETEDATHLSELQNKGLPLVLFDRVSPDINTHKVIADNWKGAYEATMHLIASGYRQIAHITSAMRVSITAERFAGYRQALADAGIPYQEQLVKYCLHGGRDPEEVKSALIDLLNLPVPPDAMLTASDRITTTSMILLHELGISIPGQIALIGFSNTTLAPVLQPPLSTIYQPAFAMGQQATQLLLQLIRNKKRTVDFETIVMSTQLDLRASSACKS